MAANGCIIQLQKDKIYPKKEECQKYLEQGYIFGTGKKNNS